MINVKRFFVGPLESCCYVVSIENSQNIMIVDPGGSPDVLIEYCQSNNLTPTMLINTHGHGDHIGANLELKNAYPNVQICVHEEDAPMLPNEYLNLSLLGGKRYQSPPADKILKDNEKLLFENVEFTVIHVPGHTLGGICLYYKSEDEGVTPILFSGDSLFNKSIGRTDFPNGSFETLVDGIKNKLFTLNGNSVVYPGHGEPTTISSEQKENPFLTMQQV